MNKVDDKTVGISLKTPKDWRQAIELEMRYLNSAEIHVRAAYARKLQCIEDRREMLEEMWRKTYEIDRCGCAEELD